MLQRCFIVVPRMLHSRAQLLSTHGRYRKKYRYRKKKEKKSAWLAVTATPLFESPCCPHWDMAARTKDAVSPIERLSFTPQKSIFRCLKDYLSVLLIRLQSKFG